MSYRLSAHELKNYPKEGESTVTIDLAWNCMSCSESEIFKSTDSMEEQRARYQKLLRRLADRLEPKTEVRG